MQNDAKKSAAGQNFWDTKGNRGHSAGNGSLKTEGDEAEGWTVKVAAKKSCRTEKAIRHLINRGVLHAAKLHGRLMLSPEEVRTKLIPGGS